MSEDRALSTQIAAAYDAEPYQPRPDHGAPTAAALVAVGVAFATYLAPAPTFSGGASAERAMMADALDLNEGGYRYAIYFKPA